MLRHKRETKVLQPDKNHNSAASSSSDHGVVPSVFEPDVAEDPNNSTEDPADELELFRLI